MSTTYTNVTFKLIRPNGVEIYPYEFTGIRGGAKTFSSLTSEEISFIIKDYSLRYASADGNGLINKATMVAYENGNEIL